MNYDTDRFRATGEVSISQASSDSIRVTKSRWAGDRLDLTIQMGGANFTLTLCNEEAIRLGTELIQVTAADFPEPKVVEKIVEAPALEDSHE